MRLLGGEANQKNFKVYNDNGHRAAANEAIFPIIKQDINTNKFSLVGTGFFISQTGLLLTAKHVLEDVILNGKSQGPIGIIHILPNNHYFIRTIMKGFWFEHSDIAAAQLDQPVHKQSKKLLCNKILKLSISKLNVNDYVFTFAYPASEILKVGNSQKFIIKPDIYEGKLIKEHPFGRDKVMLPNPCWQTDIFIHKGASGGPVFNKRGSVIGINSTSLNIAPNCSHISTIANALSLEVEVSGQKINDNNKTKFTLKQLGEIGIICIERD